ncbi:MAG: hypothetical protein AAF666_10415 [Pseudomonadota bacterium]
MDNSEIAPVFCGRLTGGGSAIPDVVDDLIRSEPLAHGHSGITPEMLEIFGLALNEVLHTISEVAGEQTVADDSSIELWVERTLVIVCVKFRGAPLPNWLLANWDRAQEPAVLAPNTETGWGWLLVREALDAVSHGWRGSEQLLYLEKRI